MVKVKLGSDDFFNDSEFVKIGSVVKAITGILLSSGSPNRFQAERDAWPYIHTGIEAGKLHPLAPETLDVLSIDHYGNGVVSFSELVEWGLWSHRFDFVMEGFEAQTTPPNPLTGVPADASDGVNLLPAGEPKRNAAIEPVLEDTQGTTVGISDGAKIDLIVANTLPAQSPATPAPLVAVSASDSGERGKDGAGMGAPAMEWGLRDKPAKLPRYSEALWVYLVSAHSSGKQRRPRASDIVDSWSRTPIPPVTSVDNGIVSYENANGDVVTISETRKGNRDAIRKTIGRMTTKGGQKPDGRAVSRTVGPYRGR